MSSVKSPSGRSASERLKILAQVPAVQVVRDITELGQQVRAHRKKQGLRIDDAAALNGVSVDLLSRLENGVGSIRTDKLLAVLDGLGLALIIAPKDHDFLKRLPLDKVLDEQPPS
jgi:transcriptional regulator with XRE-family HTH domain